MVLCACSMCCVPLYNASCLSQGADDARKPPRAVSAGVYQTERVPVQRGDAGRRQDCLLRYHQPDGRQRAGETETGLPSQTGLRSVTAIVSWRGRKYRTGIKKAPKGRIIHFIMLNPLTIGMGKLLNCSVKVHSSPSPRPYQYCLPPGRLPLSLNFICHCKTTMCQLWRFVRHQTAYTRVSGCCRLSGS